MSNAIQFLQSMGSDSALARTSVVDYAAAVAALDIDDAQQRALLDRDQAALSGLLGGRARMIFAVMAPDDVPVDAPDREQPSRDEPEPDQESLA